MGDGIVTCDYRGPLDRCCACGYRWLRDRGEGCPVCALRSALAASETALAEARREHVHDRTYCAVCELTNAALDAAEARVEEVEREVKVLSTPADPNAPTWRDAALAQSEANGSMSRALASARAELDDVNTERQQTRDLLFAARAEGERMREALRKCAQRVDDDGHPCWCSLPSMVPYRGHDSGCEAARAALDDPVSYDVQVRR